MTANQSNSKTIVTAQWLQDNINNPNLILLDASLDKTANGVQSKYQDITIANAKTFDLKNVFKDTTSNLPNTVPTPKHFEAECQKLGINNNSEIVIIDSMGIYSSPRAWWLFHLMGHDNVAVLDGGLPAWIAEGYEVINKAETAKTTVTSEELGNFTANLREELLIEFEDVLKNTKTNAFTIVDAKSKGRFDGTENDPRKNLQSGHIANSVNLPYQLVLDNEGKFKSVAELTTLFESVCKDDKPLVFSCGSGITACIIMLACEIGFQSSKKASKKVYDGSWTEWATLNNLTR